MNLLVLSALLAVAQEPVPPAAPVDLELLAAGGPARGESARLLGWESGQPRLQVRGQARAETSWLALDFGAAAIAVPEGSWRLVLGGGGLLRGRPQATAEGQAGFALTGLQDQAAVLPLDTLWVQRLGRDRLPLAEEDRDVLWARIPEGGRDVQRGYFLEWTMDGIDFEGPGGVRSFPWEELEGFGLLEEALPLPAEAVWVQLRQGSSLTATVSAVRGGRLELELPWGAAWSVGLDDVARIERLAGLVDLADDKWAVLEEPASEAMDWSPKVDRAVEGGFLRVGGIHYPAGLGVRAPTVLQRTVSRPGTLFLGVGVDDQVAAFHRPQALHFEVLLDGELLAEVGRQARGEGVEDLVLDLPQPGELTLRVRGADGLPFGGHADWLGLRFLPRPAQ
jgi:hypothetical protein